MELKNDVENLINRIEVKTIKDVLDYFDCGLVNNNCNTNYMVYMDMIHRFLLDNEEKISEFLFELLKQTNLIILKLHTHENAELKGDYYKMRRLIIQSLRDNNEELFNYI